jgi:Ion channel
VTAVNRPLTSTYLKTRLFRRAGRRHQRLSLAGPVAFVTVIATWAGLLVLGWALLFWPHMPSGFRFDAGVEAGGPGFVHALNVSLVTLTTLGFGDITPTSNALRLILPLEALLGFGLLSASGGEVVGDREVHAGRARRLAGTTRSPRLDHSDSATAGV